MHTCKHKKTWKWHTYARRQRVIPGSPFSCHALQCWSPMQSVSRLTSVCDAAPGEVALVVDFEAKLRHTRVLAVRQLKTWREILHRERMWQCTPRNVEDLRPTWENKLVFFFFWLLFPKIKAIFILKPGTLQYSFTSFADVTDSVRLSFQCNKKTQKRTHEALHYKEWYCNMYTPYQI